LKGHVGLVNVVRWVPGREEGNEFIVSGGVDHSVRIWNENEEKVLFDVHIVFHVLITSFRFCRF